MWAELHKVRNVYLHKPDPNRYKTNVKTPIITPPNKFKY